VLLLPTSPVPPFRLGERLQDPIAMYLSDLFTVSANLAGIPALSLPAGRSSEGLPIGLQLQAPHYAEERLLAIAQYCLRLWSSASP
jgi:aspartyl-tRNA(Asn)/glutamyl-tRNA(Gln) amidotransferase subunit A